MSPMDNEASAEAADAAAEDPEDSAPTWPPAELVLTLRKPITDAAGGAVAELHLREPTDDEWVKFSAFPEETRRRQAISLITKIPLETIARIGIGDTVRAENYFQAFFMLGQAIQDW